MNTVNVHVPQDAIDFQHFGVYKPLFSHVHFVHVCTCISTRVPLQGFNRHSNTGSLAAQPPPTVVHSSCSSFVSSPSSSSAKLPVAERFVNRRGNADPLSSQAPPTVVHNIHGLSLGKFLAG